MQLIDYVGTKVRVYHTYPHLSGTDRFECGGVVDLTTLKYHEEKTAYPMLEVPCPSGCGAVMYLPLTGDTDAQRAHAHFRLADPADKAKTLSDAIESVLCDVEARNGVPSVQLAIQAIADNDNLPVATAVLARAESDAIQRDIA